MGFKKSHIINVLFGLLTITACLFLIFEWLQLQTNYNETYAVEKATNNVDAAFDQFQNQVFDFSSSSTAFADQFESALNEDSSFSTLSSYDSDFWGTTVYKKDEPVYWSGYSSTAYLDSLSAANTEVKIRRVRQGNVRYIESIIPLVIEEFQDTTLYQVYTRFLLEQDIFGKVGNMKNEGISAQIFPDFEFPIEFAITRTTPDSIIHAREFTSVSGDYIGTVYAIEADIDRYLLRVQDKIRVQRSFFILSILLGFAILSMWISRRLNFYLRFSIHMALIFIIYFVSQPLLLRFIDGIFVTDIYQSIFLVLAFLALFYLLKSRAHQTSKSLSENIILSFFLGVFTVLSWLFLLSQIYDGILTTQLNLFNQVLNDSYESTIWLMAVGGVLLVVSGLFVHLISKLSSTSSGTNWMAILAIVLGVSAPLLIILFLADQFGIQQVVVKAATLGIGSLLVLVLFQVQLSLFKYQISLLRSLLMLVVIISAASTATIYTAFDDTLFEKLKIQSQEFEADTQGRVREVITNLLNAAYDEIRVISLFSVYNFEEIVENLIQEEWLKYSFSLQLIDSEGTPLSAFNTDLSVPQWTTDYRIDELIIPYEEERIRRDNLRPILRNQPINTVNAEYSYFMRGWIPVYQNRFNDRIGGWILASLYQEIPELNRPFRSVVNGTIQSPEEIAFSFTEYADGVPARTVVSGTLTTIPDYGVLPKSLITQVTDQFAVERVSNLQNLSVRELFTLSKNGTVIRAAHIKISNAQVLYLFLRIFFTIAIPLILLLTILFGSPLSNRFSESRRIRDRLMDRSIIASIFCLFLLIGATSIILDNQNETEVQTTLRDQLITLTETLTEATSSEQNSLDFLENITAVLGVDASVYVNGRLSNSTTPSIYNQNLIPASIPWTIYHQIGNEGAQLAIDILRIGDQDLMVGYQPFFNAENEIAGIVAIPTFLKTPDYYSRLLSTTSYLLAFYSIIFGILILSIGIISARITAPLELLEKGLEKISSGDLNSRINISSNDEIGMLSQAYNEMVGRLKKLQEELAQTEREAAWKEMAQQVAHEIKNPLTPMKLNLQHLERQLHQTGEELSLDKPKISAITNSMIEQIEALNKIASDFSKFARPTSNQFVEVKVNELIASVVAMYPKDQLQISTHFDSREFIVLGVSDELRRVFVNLIKNAAEAIQSEGKIQINTFWNTGKKAVEIKIIDDGIGISEEEAANIFLPNFSTKTSGTGLGLAITKKIIEEHNGSITFESEPTKGTTFTISLPLKTS